MAIPGIQRYPLNLCLIIEDREFVYLSLKVFLNCSKPDCLLARVVKCNLRKSRKYCVLQFVCKYLFSAFLQKVYIVISYKAVDK